MKKRNLQNTLLLMAALLLASGCSRQDDKAPALRNVMLTSVSSLSGDASTTYPGVVEEGASVSAAFMADGKIARIAVKEGDRVHKGQLLAALDDSDYRIGVSQLEAQFNQMTKEKERMDAMFEKHNIAPNDYEKFQTGYEQLKLQLDGARRRLDYTRLNAPASGYISTKYMNEGELVGAGTPVVNIVDDSRLMASVDLPVGVYLERSHIAAASGSVPGVAGSIPLSIVSFTPDADNNMLYHMKLAIPSSVARELTPGMNISVTLETSENTKAEAIIPSRAIVAQDGKTFVWVYNAADSTIHRKAVTVEGAPSGKMSVVKGVMPGESIVETGVKQLYEGEKVNVLNRKDIGL
ncbi:MAG: efflux RND transporter periplasmic adaptor subunit [Muribaculaceae bacterium]|nr:efflux RND transporter periplasmic adaptor subunit [Muribaculaceae bacterium]